MASTMRGVRIHDHGDLDHVVFDVGPTPEPGPGEVRVRLRAAALNHLDLFVVRGIPGIDMPLPHVMGADGAGVVDALGDSVQGWQAGDEVVLNPGLWCGTCEFCVAGEQSMCADYRLLGEHVDGTFAEAIVVPTANLHRKPENLSWHEAAAFPLVTLTAWRMLVTRAGVGPGQTVLVHGIGGGVSLVSLQIALAAGATVFVTSHDESKLAKARAMGAAETWNYSEVDVVAKVREVTDKRGVDIVVDNVGAATFAASVEAVRKGGSIVTCGVTTGPKLPIDGRRVFWKHINILGSTMGSEADFRAMLRAVASGKIRPSIDGVLPLAQGREALHRLRDGAQFGKIVLDVGAG